MVDVPPPAAIGDVAVTVDSVADTVPGFTTTVAVCVMATELMVAEMVFVSAVVELSVPVATPLALVVPTGCVNVLPVVGVAASTTVAPAIGLPLASLAVTVMVDVPLPAAIGEVAVTVDWLALGAPAVPVAVNVTGLPVIPDPPAVAVRAFGPAVVLRVQLPTVAMPLPFVVWLPPVMPPFPCVTANVTATPTTGFPAPSCTSTDGGEPTALPTGADWVVGLLAVIAPAAPAPSVIVPDVADASAVALKLSVRSPAVPLIARLVKLATPVPIVVAVRVPPNVPPPVAIVAVTTTPAWFTGLPAPSRTCSTGC